MLGRVLFRFTLPFLIWFAAPLTAQAACDGDCIMQDQFEDLFWKAETSAEAARFLNQASFGATTASIASVQTGTYQGWIDAQFTIPQTLARPFLETVALQRHNANQNVTQDDRIHRWFDTAVTAPDQLRQKMAYALSQIIVASDVHDGLDISPMMMAEWNDILVRNAFGNYRDLLREVSFSPTMGRYLSSLRNRKFELTPTYSTTPGSPPSYNITAYAAGNNGNEPDENYGREVMQLFSMGLIDRNRNFSIVDTDLVTPEIQPSPTYDQQMVRTMARAFTGLAYDCTPTAVVQGITIQQNCAGSRNSAPPANPSCTGIHCRFSNAITLFGSPPPVATLPSGNASSLIHPDLVRPMVCYPRYNDNGRDQQNFQLPGQTPTHPVNTTIAAGVEIPAGAPTAEKPLTLSGVVLQTLPEFYPGQAREAAPNCGTFDPNLNLLSNQQRQECVDYCENNVRSAVDLLFNHPNTAPMVARQLILRFVTSNPSPEYIDRVAAVFENNGAGVRGDLKATLKAILLDVEARQPFTGQFGKPREPMLKLVAIWRHFQAVSGGGTCRNPDYVSGGISCWGPNRPETAYFQRPLGAPSVFNFYEPDYQPPGDIADNNLYAPEFQIINENSLMQTANDLFRRICESYGNDNCSGAFANSPPTDHAYIPPANLDALPGMACTNGGVNSCTGTDDQALIEELNLRMLGGQMSGAIADPDFTCPNFDAVTNPGMKGVLHNLLHCGMADNLGQAGANAARDARRRKALYLIHMIAISPEYAHQR